eukprot:4607991-Prorocentrum_lima.AAC.1
MRRGFNGGLGEGSRETQTSRSCFLRRQARVEFGGNRTLVLEEVNGALGDQWFAGKREWANASEER